MSNQYGPRIVTDGLVLCLDAGNSKSYPGSGTVWTDLSGNNNNGTLTNGPTYNSANKGSIIFDGINDFVNISPSSSLSTTTAITVTSIVRITGFAINRARLLDTNGTIADNIGANIALKIGTISPFQDISWFILSGSSAYEVKRTTSIITSTSQIYTISARWRSSDGSSSIFVNGIEAPYALSTTFSSPANTLVNNLSIGLLRRFNIYGNQRIYGTHIYNRYLSDNEILQNYNATKGRFV